MGDYAGGCGGSTGLNARVEVRCKRLMTVPKLTTLDMVFGIQRVVHGVFAVFVSSLGNDQLFFSLMPFRYSLNKYAVLMYLSNERVGSQVYM